MILKIWGEVEGGHPPPKKKFAEGGALNKCIPQILGRVVGRGYGLAGFLILWYLYGYIYTSGQ